MHKQLMLAGVACLLATSALAQTSNATATGVGISGSQSQSGSVAIAGGGSVNIAAAPAVTTSNIVQSGTVTSNQNVHTSGTSTVKTVPTAVAPSLAAAGIETCLGSISGGGSAVGFGASFGTTIPDPGCAARLDARTLWNMGLKGAAVARLCLNPDIYKSMPDVCEKYRPAGAPTPILLSASVNVGGGPTGAIQVVDGRTGLTRGCDNYDSIKHKCWQWSGEQPLPRRRVASLSPTHITPAAHKPKPLAKPAAPPTAVAAKPVEPKTETKVEDKK